MVDFKNSIMAKLKLNKGNISIKKKGQKQYFQGFFLGRPTKDSVSFLLNSSIAYDLFFLLSGCLYIKIEHNCDDNLFSYLLHT